MPLSVINIGTVGNDDTGDTLRTGGYKINENFVYLQDQINDLALVSGGGGGSGITDLESDTSPTLGGDLDLNGFDVGDATNADLTKLHAVTVTSTEINYLDGVTSNIQDQIDGLGGTALDDYIALVASDLETEGASQVGIYNPLAEQFSGATNVQEALDDIYTNYLNSLDVSPIVEDTSFTASDFILFEKADGSYFKVQSQVALSGEPSSRKFSTTSTDLVLTDHNGTVISTGSASATINVPANATTALPINTEIKCVRNGSGSVSIQGATGVVINGASAGSVTISDRYGVIRLLKTDTDEWAAPDSAAGTVTDVVAPTLVSWTPGDNATDVVIGVSPEFTFSEDIQFGTGNITLRTNNGGWSNAAVYDVTSPGSNLSIVGNKLTVDPSSNLANSREYAFRFGSSAIKDLAGNSYAGIADDTTASFTTVAAAPSGPTIVASGTGVITTGSGDQTFSLPALQQNDKVWVAQCCDGTGLAAPTGYTNIYLVSASNNPGRALSTKVMGASPDTSVTIPRVFSRRQSVVWWVTRNTNTSNYDGQTFVDTPMIATGSGSAPDGPAYVQANANIIRFNIAYVDEVDVTLTAPSGWTLIQSATTGGAASGEQCSVAVAYYPVGGSVSTSVNPGAWGGSTVQAWACVHIGQQ